MAQMTVQIVTPDGLIYDHHAAFVSVKTIEGELGILPRHINTIAVLEVDQVKVRRVDDDKHIDWIAVMSLPLWQTQLSVSEISTLVGLRGLSSELSKKSKKHMISI